MAKKIECSVYLFGEEVEVNGKAKIKSIGLPPVFMTKGAACADCAVPFEEMILPHQTKVIDLWIGFEIPVGYKIVMYPRSSLLVKKGLMSPVSIIDQDFSGNKVHFPVHNLTNQPVRLAAGERVCQIELAPAMKRSWQDNWDQKEVERGAEGFGTTGEK